MHIFSSFLEKYPPSVPKSAPLLAKQLVLTLFINCKIHLAVCLFNHFCQFLDNFFFFFKQSICLQRFGKLRTFFLHLPWQKARVPHHYNRQALRLCVKHYEWEMVERQGRPQSVSFREFRTLRANAFMRKSKTAVMLCTVKNTELLCNMQQRLLNIYCKCSPTWVIRAYAHSWVI